MTEADNNFDLRRRVLAGGTLLFLFVGRGMAAEELVAQRVDASVTSGPPQVRAVHEATRQVHFCVPAPPAGLVVTSSA